MAVKKASFEKLASKFLNNTFADFAKDIRIIEEIETDNGRGGTNTNRVLFAATICFIFPMTGKENVEAGGLYSDQMFKFSMKPVANLTNKMIIEYNCFDYKIESVENIVEADVWINVMAEKDKSDG